MQIVSDNPAPKQQLRPFCNICGWRKGGLDSWNGVTCKCGHTEQPIERLDELQSREQMLHDLER